MKKMRLAILLCGTSFALASKFAVAEPAKASTTEAAKIAAMQTEIEKEFFVGMQAIKDICVEQFPKNAKQIERGFAANFSTAPDDLKSFAKTKAFASRVAERKKEQLVMIKNPDEKKQFESQCSNLAMTELVK